MQQGWIKLHRELINKPIWTESTAQQKTVLITLLLMANHNRKEWEWKGKKYQAKPGQLVTSLNSIARNAGVGISIQNVRTSLKRFEKFGFLTNESTNKNRLITIVNWDIYQEKESSLTKGLTGDQQATNKQLTTNKNVRIKECKNSTKRDSRKRVYDETSNYYQLAIFFYKQIQQNNPNHKKPNFQTWSDDIRKMIDLDKRTEEQVKYLMKWVQQDNFEMTNVLSPAKMRKRFDQLAMKVKRESKQVPSNVTPITQGAKKYNYGF